MEMMTYAESTSAIGNLLAHETSQCFTGRVRKHTALYYPTLILACRRERFRVTSFCFYDNNCEYGVLSLKYKKYINTVNLHVLRLAMCTHAAKIS